MCFPYLICGEAFYSFFCIFLISLRWWMLVINWSMLWWCFGVFTGEGGL